MHCRSVLELGTAKICSFLFFLLVFSELRAQEKSIESIKASASKASLVQELLTQLDKDYQSLRQSSPHKLKLEQAEKLLAETNDNTTWTNFSIACKILREHRAKAAVPLLLKYMIVHTDRSSRHVIIPEYIKTLEQLTGKTLVINNPGTEKKDALAEQISQWWRENEAQIQVDPQEMDDHAFVKYANNLLNEIKGVGEFTRTRAERETCYVTNQTVHYNLLKKAESSRPLNELIVPRLLPLVLKACDEAPVFAYEAVWLLSDFCKVGLGEKIRETADDPNQSAAVRLACWLGMYRAGYVYPSKELVELYRQEKDFERRLVILASMRWGNRDVVPTLLIAMDDPNFEIASAAACAVVKFQTTEAIAKFEKLLSVERDSPLLVYNALADLKTYESKLLLKTLLKDGLNGGANQAHLGRLLDAFESAWGARPNIRPRVATIFSSGLALALSLRK
ncbi:MAG: HEAT repeat domain-containing protein [Pirellulales bacterium]